MSSIHAPLEYAASYQITQKFNKLKIYGHLTRSLIKELLSHVPSLSKDLAVHLRITFKTIRCQMKHISVAIVKQQMDSKIERDSFKKELSGTTVKHTMIFSQMKVSSRLFRNMTGLFADFKTLTPFAMDNFFDADHFND